MLHKGRRAAAGKLKLTSFSFLSTQDGTNASPETYSSVSFGAADANRYIIIACHNFDQTISSVTIGGVSATQLVAEASTNRGKCYFYGAKVPTGTSGDIVVTSAVAPNANGLSVYRMIHGGDPLSADLFDTDAAVHSSGVVTFSINTSMNGVLIAMTAASNASTTTWANATEDADVDIESTDYLSSASTFPTADNTGLAVTATNLDTTPNQLAGCAVSFRR